MTASAAYKYLSMIDWRARDVITHSAPAV